MDHAAISHDGAVPAPSKVDAATDAMPWPPRVLARKESLVPVRSYARAGVLPRPVTSVALHVSEPAPSSLPTRWEAGERQPCEAGPTLLDLDGDS
jgi:hypothetical protein